MLTPGFWICLLLTFLVFLWVKIKQRAHQKKYTPGTGTTITWTTAEDVSKYIVWLWFKNENQGLKTSHHRISIKRRPDRMFDHTIEYWTK